MSSFHGINSHLDQSIRVAHPESIHTIPHPFFSDRKILDTSARVTPNSLFEHQLDDTSMFYTPIEKIVTARKGGRIEDPPPYLLGRLEYLRQINKIVNKTKPSLKFIDSENIFPNGPFRDAVIARRFETQDRVRASIESEGERFAQQLAGSGQNPFSRN